MIKRTLNAFIVVAMLVAFVGQALAFTAMSCDMSSESSHQSHQNMDHSAMGHADMDHSMMDHSTMNHGTMSNNSQNSHEDCCGADCACPVAACMNISMVGSEPKTAYLARLSEAVFSPSVNHTTSIYTSLYRPPIFA
ncbi:hypothetical protein [Thalassotalea agarivorans]|uniref:Uncharacterized protein n=1 Tax=Thalassotalea agarivorans TaxID=349064 RepID=A0A1I0BG50_THASX|nr:hypothetical protein [Thalassotalea agarivorans]SET05838.1 hypothetical protein SAMN05660429_00941 [Thalassotalea agarivorans]